MRPASCAFVLLLLSIVPALSAQDSNPPATQSLPIMVAPESQSGDAGSPAAPFDPGAAFINANAAYDDGDYEQAVGLYRLLLDNGFDSAQVHYNLGNALLRNGELGQAVASYRRSQALAPRDQDLEANLSFARRATKDALAPPRPSALAATLFFWHFGLSRAELAAATVALNLLLWTLLALRLFRRRSELLRWTTIVVLILTLAAGGSLALRHAAPDRVAVVIPAEVDALTGPDPGAVVRFKLHAGTEVRVKDTRDGWLRIALPDGQQGWIAGEHVEVVTF